MRSTPVKIGVTTYTKRVAAVKAMQACERKYPDKPRLTISQFWDEKSQSVKFKLVPFVGK